MATAGCLHSCWESQSFEFRIAETAKGNRNNYYNSETAFSSPFVVDSLSKTLPRRPRSKASDNIATEYSRKSALRYSLRQESSDLSSRLEELSVNKLQFSRLRLYGRDESIQKLEDCVRQVTIHSKGVAKMNSTIFTQHSRPASSRQLVLISGNRGTGKTSLAKSMKETARRKGGLFACGKFDQNLRNEPYSGIAAACRQLCSEIETMLNKYVRIEETETTAKHDQDGCGDISKNKKHHQFMRSKLVSFREGVVKELAGDTFLLSNIIPELEDIFWEYCVGSGDCGSLQQKGQGSPQQQQNFKESKSRFQYALQRFLRVVTNSFGPLVLVLDDLQWADPSSMELLELLVADQENSALLIIGCYRTNDIEDGHRLCALQSASNLDKEINQRGYGLVEIKVGCLSNVDINDLLVDLLLIDDPTSTLELANLCHRKTLGNPFFLTHFIALLEQKGLLQYNLGLLRWTWDVSEVEIQALASDNVVDVLKMKIDQLSTETLRCLRLASCLGFVFSFHTLQLVWKEYPCDGFNTDIGASNLRVSLDATIKEGFLEESKTSGEYRWVHDNLQEACLVGIPPDELCQMRYRIGWILVAGLTAEELEWTIFVATDLLNEGTQGGTTAEERIRLAKLNLRAAEEAVKMSAFESAEKYVTKGIALLETEPWQKDYKVSILLYSLGAETAGYFGRIDLLNKYCNQVLENGRCFEDKLRAYNAQFDSLLSRDPSEAVKYGFSILKHMGCSFPRSTARVIPAKMKGVLEAKRSLKTIRAETAALPEMKDPQKFEMMKILVKLIIALCFSNWLQNRGIAYLVTLRMLKLTKKHGICDLSPFVYALYGSFLSGWILKDFQGGAVYTECALALLGRMKSSIYLSRTIFIVHLVGLHFYRPAHDSLKPLLAGYHEGMKTGDTESAMSCINTYTGLAFMSGTSLNDIATCCKTYLPQMKLLKKEITWMRTKSILQVVHNLMGEPEDPCTEVLTEVDFLASTNGLFLNFKAHQLLLLTHLGEYVRGADVDISLGQKLQKARPCVASTIMQAFTGGMCNFAAARMTKKRKYRKRARECLATVNSYIKKGNPNARHWGPLLAAENEALKGRKAQAIKYYLRGIYLASRCGFRHDAAMGHLRLGEYLLNAAGGDEEDALFRIKQSVKLYSEWGAMATVERILENYAELLEGNDSS